MRRSLFWVLCGLASVSVALAQTGPDTLWTRTYGGGNDDWGYVVQPTRDGGFIFGGQSRSYGAGMFDLWLVKTDADGDTQWTRTYGGSESEGARGIQQLADGDFIVIGSTRSFGAGGSDFYLIRTDSLGNPRWSRTFGGTAEDYGRGLDQTADGGFILVGMTRSFGAGSTDIYLVKTDALGFVDWTRTIGTPRGDEGRAIQVTSDGGYIIAGAQWSGESVYSDARLIKTTSGGTVLWSRTFGGEDQDWFNAVHETRDHRFMAAGQTWSTGAGSSDLYLVLTEDDGDSVWARTYGGIGAEEANAAQETAEGGFVASGYTTSFGAGGRDFYVVKTSLTGDTLWTRTYGGADDDQAWDVQQTADEQFVFAGEAYSFGSGGSDFYLVRTGRVPCQPVTDLAIGYNPLPSSFVLTWTAMQRGDYLIYGTSNPNNTGDPLHEPGWTLEVVLDDLPAGATLFTYSPPLTGYQNFVIIAECP